MSKFIFIIVVLIIINISNSYPQQNSNLYNGLNPGPYIPGFKVEEKLDFSRTILSQFDGSPSPRKIRVYTWYPSSNQSKETMQVSEYLFLAAEDFGNSNQHRDKSWTDISIPVQLKKGIRGEQLEQLWKSKTISVKNTEPTKGNYPVIVLGQGLYYESPISQFVLCEYLASNGFVVVTSPLFGTQYRLVNINVSDVETQIRDMEFLISYSKTLSFVDKNNIGLCGYDLGGISGLLLCMRNSEIRSYFSLDCSIQYPHYTGLPNTHPNYDEKNFCIPWMHITQTRFIKNTSVPLLYDRKIFGDSYLLLVSTKSHGDFTSYANFNISNPVQGYWGEPTINPKIISKVICNAALSFFETYLKKSQDSFSKFKILLEKEHQSDSLFVFDMKKGDMPSPSKSYFVNLITEKGISKALPEIEKARKIYADTLLFDENVLNWLGYHFLYWWGRERESLELFKLMVSIYPNSFNAFDSLGEVYLTIGEKDKAIEMYEKSLKLNPQNQNAKSQIESLRNQK